VVEVAVEGVGEAATPEQLELFVEEVRRQRKAAERALARIRARFGNEAVVRARLEEAHLPEARFVWESLAQLGEARPRAVRDGVLVRRILARPVPLPARSRREPDGWMLRGLAEGPVVRIHGPYLVSGGWWARRVHREYHFAETQRGDLLWVFYDRVRRRWFLHGRVE
jgi:protein ImuB